MNKNKLFTSGWSDYELLDAGGNKKLERWGDIVTVRPERQAYFQSGMSFSQWDEQAHLIFESTGKHSGQWKTKKGIEKNREWKVNFGKLSFLLSPTKFKHIGLFPEQKTNWDYLATQLAPGDKMLNLFAYTGAASLVGKQCGADVTHVDSVKQLITWARKNMENSELEGIRWVHEDALKFARREVKRNNTYDCVVMDPPAWGIGAKKEKWKIEDQLPQLIQMAHALLRTNGTLILNTYSPRVDVKMIAREAKPYFNYFTLQELWMQTKTGKSLFYGHLLRAKK
ncbi:MAG: class I SAM-dependent methyltransferase [Bacteroidota bacterium]